MSVKDDIINELGNIPLEVMKPADNTNYVQQQLEKDSWGRKLNTQTFKQFEDSINILKGSSMYTLNTMVELETFNTEILRLDNKNISQDLDINSKVDFTTYTTKMTALDNKDADLQLQLNNIPNLYVDKTTYNTKMTSLDLKDTELTTLVNSKVDSKVYSTNISNLQSQISSKVSNTTYTNDLNNIDIKNNNQDSLINNLQSNKADILYVDSQIDILENVNTVQDNAIDNLILTKADKSDVLTKLEMNSTLNNYALKSYVDGTFLTTTNASSTYVSLANYNNSELIHSNEILSLQNGKANITDIYTRTQGDQRYLLRSEYTGGTGGTGGTVDLSAYATLDSVYTRDVLFTRTEISTLFSNNLSNYLLNSDATNTYLKLSGGVLTGDLNLKNSSNLGTTYLTNNSVNSSLLKGVEIYNKEFYTTYNEVDYTKIMSMSNLNTLNLGSTSLNFKLNSLTNTIPVNDTFMTLASDFDFFNRNINLTQTSYLKMSATSTTNANASLVDGRVSGSLIYGDLSKNIELKGATIRPKYNNVELALKSDIKSTNTNEFINGSISYERSNPALAFNDNQITIDIINLDIIDTNKDYSLYYLKMSFNDTNNTPILPFDIITVNNGQGGTPTGEHAIGVEWNLEGNDFKITLTDNYFQGVLNNVQYFEINKLFGIG
jgi:hypothetical protein